MIIGYDIMKCFFEQKKKLKICPICKTKNLKKIPFKIGYRCKKCLKYVENPLTELDEWEID